MSNILIVMRHGEAERARVGGSDAQRKLTPYGASETKAAAQWLVFNGHAFDSIIVSPYLRAQETAAIVARVCGVDDLIVCDSLTPDTHPSRAVTALEGLVRPKSLVVSHMPLVGALAGCLIDGSLQSSRSFCVSEVVGLEYEVFGRGLASLEWGKAP